MSMGSVVARVCPPGFPDSSMFGKELFQSIPLRARLFCHHSSHVQRVFGGVIDACSRLSHGTRRISSEFGMFFLSEHAKIIRGPSR